VAIFPTIGYGILELVTHLLTQCKPLVFLPLQMVF